ncbi:MAG: sigma 54-interacting transcriptional regulator [Candidatus Sumerlaeia bacterium]|nr:sigma 54-interacting transcriptional regulator [Candidatus Sumerlaeia bacterium]
MKLDLADATRIGRAEGNDLVLSDALVSREHARITRRNLSWLIEDLGSRHGTFLNRRRVEGTRPLLTNDEVQIGQSRFLFDGDVDVQNADFSDQSVYLAAPTDETLEVPPVAVLPPVEHSDAREQVAGLEFVVQLGELFDSTRVAFPDALHAACLRLAALFRAEALVLFLRDTVANDLRPSVALFPGGETLTDSSLVRRVAHDRKSLLVSDRPELAAHPAPGAPQPPATRSVLCAPVELDEALLGVLYLQRGELDAYSLVDLRHIRAVARLLAVFIEARQRAAALEMRSQYASSESDLVGAGPAFRAVRDMLAKVAPTPASVLLTGESGTGKEMIAREIHRLSSAGARGAEFVAVNCSAIPETLFESHLFGHEKGAFTGAVRTQQGFIYRARQRRHALPRRDRRTRPCDAAQAPALPAGARLHPRRRHALPSRRRAPDLRDEPQPRRGGPRRALPRGPLPPHLGHADRAPPPAPTHRGHPGPGRAPA